MKKFVIAIGILIVSIVVLGAADIRPLTVDMSNTKVSTEKQAESRLYEHLIQAKDDGLSATQSARTVAKFKVGFNIKEFAKTGDRIWQVHLVGLDTITVERIAWVNAESATVLFPIEKKK